MTTEAAPVKLSTWLPFSDAASENLPMGRLLRLSLFQVSVGMATVLLLGTLNRVMIVELSVPARLVAIMVALPVLIAPFRAFLGHRSDTYRSAIGWRRAPYLWFGALWQFGGLAIMPFSLIVLSGDQTLGPDWAGEALAALSFLLVGLGLNMTQTAGLALASDLSDEETRPRVVALLYVMFLVGMALSAAAFGALLADFSKIRLIQVVQGAAVVTLVLNLFALWRQEHLNPMEKAAREAPRPAFGPVIEGFLARGRVARLLTAIFVGTAAFSMQDVLLEPYGGQVLGLGVGQTTTLTAFWATGALIGFWYAGRLILRGADECRIGAWGVLVGVLAFTLVIFAGPLGAAPLFFAGASLIGFGSGLFAVSTLTAVMGLSGGGAGAGLALGAWGAAQATAAGIAVGLGGVFRDVADGVARSGMLGSALDTPATGYAAVYTIEIVMLFATLVVLGPLARHSGLVSGSQNERKLGLADFPS